MRARRIATVVLALATSGALMACGEGGDAGAGGAPGARSAPGSAAGGAIRPVEGAAGTPAMTVGSKNFTEQFILGEIYAQALQAAGFRVHRRLDLGSEQIAYRSLRRGRIDAYPEYTGTMLTAFYGVRTKDVPKDPEEAFRQARAQAARDGVAALPRTPFTDSNGFAMTRARAEELGVNRLSDLADEADDLSLAGPPECRRRADCKLGLEQVYGLRFERFLPIELSRRHAVLTDGRADVSLVFTTDGQIRTEDLQLLEDDRALFPPYNASLLVRQDILDAHPGMQEVVELVQQGLTTEVMQELNSRVDLDRQEPARVARDYLVEAGYLAG